MLQSAVQSLQWTYSFLWQFCPKQGVLVWADGYYNGSIRTRKIVQPSNVTAEEASLERSGQLKELYNSLLAEAANPQPELRPWAALSPEDLTATEWFYLTSMSYTFPPDVGLPGKAFERQQPIWLSRANEVDRKVFSRALLAKSTQIQTVLCIPLADGVLELGTTDNVEEDLALIQHARRFLIGQHGLPTHDNKDDREDDNNPANSSSNSELVTENNAGSMGATARPCDMAATESAFAQAEPSELMHIETLEELLLRSPGNVSNYNFPSNHHMLGTCCITSYSGRQSQESLWPLDNNATDVMISSQSPGETTVEDTSHDDDAQYCPTVSATVQCNLGPRVGSRSDVPLERPPQSAFNTWTCQRDPSLLMQHVGSSQWMLKYTLRRVPYLHGWSRDRSLWEQRDEGEPCKVQKVMPQEEMGRNHVLAERKRREKLNECFLILRSLVPSMTKMDKITVLENTIEYIKQLLRRVQDCESHMH